MPKITCPLTICAFPECACPNPTTADYHAAKVEVERLRAALEMVINRYGFAGLYDHEADEIDALLAEDDAL